MNFVILVPYTDLADERPRVEPLFIEAASEEEARTVASELAVDARKLMDLTVEDWPDIEGLEDLEGDALLREHGIAFGHLEVWNEGKFVWLAETPFEPAKLTPYEPPR